MITEATQELSTKKSTLNEHIQRKILS